MNRLARLILVCGAVTAAVVVGGGCSGSRELTVASVGGKRIAKSLLDHWMAVAAAAGYGTASGRAVMKRQVLGLLISWEWTLGEAREMGVTVRDWEAKKQLALSKAAQLASIGYNWFTNEDEIAKFLVSRNVATADQLWLVRLGMLATRLGRRRLAHARSEIGRSRIAAYYERNKRDFVVGERRDIKAVINYSKAQVNEAKRELRAGTSFSSVAERFNQSVEGGLRLGRARGTGKKRYEKDYFAAPPHVLVGPLKEIMYYIFEVVSIRPGHQETRGEAEPTIRRRLAAHDANTSLLQAYEREWRARTRCLTGYLAKACGTYVTNIT